MKTKHAVISLVTGKISAAALSVYANTDNIGQEKPYLHVS